MKRRCGRLRGKWPAAPKVVWARNGVGTFECPKSLISGESAAWVEYFCAWKRLGGARLESMPARQAHAFLILERELAKIHAEE